MVYEETARRILDASRRARRPARVAAAVAVLSGLLNLATAALPEDRHRLHVIHRLFPGEVSTSAVAVVAASGVGMLLLANGLHRRGRVAWFAAIALLMLSAFGHVIKGLDVLAAMGNMFLAGCLVGAGEHFTARFAHVRSVRTRFGEAVAVVASAYAFAVIGVYYASNEGWVQSFHGAWRLLAFNTTPEFPLHHRAAETLGTASHVVLIVGLLVVIARMLAPTPPKRGNPASPDEALQSEDSLAWFATREDRITVRSRGAGVSYGQFGSVALASGDPLGKPEDWPLAIDEFFAEVAQQGRYAAVLACGSRAAEVYKQAGLSAIYLGDEAVLDFTRFSLAGGGMKTVRNSVTRAGKAGYTSRIIRVSDLDVGLARALWSISDQWRGDEDERGFSMALGRLLDPNDGTAYLIVGFDGESRPRGFIQFVPWRRDGVSLDVMRRDREALPVLNDFLVAEAARQFPEMGIQRMSLNFSALRGVLVAGSESGAGWILKLERWALLKLSSSFQIETLYRFNKKFQPQWVPRYLLIGAREDTPVVFWAALRAEGLLPRVAFFGYLRRKPREQASSTSYEPSTDEPLPPDGSSRS